MSTEIEHSFSENPPSSTSLCDSNLEMSVEHESAGDDSAILDIIRFNCYPRNGLWEIRLERRFRRIAAAQNRSSTIL